MNDKHTPEFSKAVSRLTLTNIFFTALLYNLKVVQSDDIPTMATDGATLYYNPQFAASLTTEDCTAVLVHEILHVILYHSLRRGARHPILWNIAADYVVNGTMAEYGVVVPKCGIQPRADFSGLTAEQVYDKLLQEAQDAGQDLDGLDSPAGTGMDIQDYDPNAPGNEGKTATQVEREIGVATEKAIQTAKAAGQLPAGMKAMIEASQVQREPWYSHLRRYMTTLNARQYNWSRIDTRRAVCQGIIAPQMRSEQMGKIVVGVDESGSISDRDLSAISAHLTDICKECRPKEVVVIYHDSAIPTEGEGGIVVFEGPEYHIQLERVCGGGTDFRPVFREIETNHGDAQVVLMFTDMGGPAGDAGPGPDVLWVTPSKNATPPFGEIVYANFAD